MPRVRARDITTVLLNLSIQTRQQLQSRARVSQSTSLDSHAPADVSGELAGLHNVACMKAKASNCTDAAQTHFDVQRIGDDEPDTGRRKSSKKACLMGMVWGMSVAER